MGRDANRSADVGADLERGEPGRDRGRRTTRRPAGHVVDVPRVVRRPEELVVGLVVAGPTGDVGLAEHDGAGVLQPRDGRCVLRGDVVGELDRAARRADALDLDRVLDRDREPVERSAPLAAYGLGVGAVRLGPGPIEVERHHRVDGAVQPVDARCEELQQLPARDLAVADRGGLLGGGCGGEALVETHRFRSWPCGPGRSAPAPLTTRRPARSRSTPLIGPPSWLAIRPPRLTGSRQALGRDTEVVLVAARALAPLTLVEAGVGPRVRCACPAPPGR